MSIFEARLRLFAARCSLRWLRWSSRAKRLFFEAEPKIWLQVPFLKMNWYPPEGIWNGLLTFFMRSNCTDPGLWKVSK